MNKRLMDIHHRYSGMTIAFNNFPKIISDKSSLFELSGYNYISFGFDYAKEDIDNMKSLVSKGDMRNLIVFMNDRDETILSWYGPFSDFTKNYQRFRVDKYNIPSEFKYGDVINIRSFNISYISTLIVSDGKINNIEISMCTHHSDTTFPTYKDNTFIYYIFNEVVKEILSFMYEHYDPKYNSKKGMGVGGYLELLFNSKKFVPLNYLFKEKGFSFKNNDIEKYISKTNSVIINISIK